MYLIIGCGRSGTCWLAETISKAPHARVTIEDPLIFPLVELAAYTPDLRPSLLPSVEYQYRMHNTLALTFGDVYVDKSHQNIWLVEEWLEKDMAIGYIAIRREKAPVVKSYKAMGMPEKEAERKWEAHEDRLWELRHSLHEDELVTVSYEAMVEDPEWVAAVLGGYLGLDVPPPEYGVGDYVSKDRKKK